MSRSEVLPQLGDGLFLTDAGIETVLIFEHGFDLPCFATFPLLESERGAVAIRSYLEPYLDLARESDAGFMLDTMTWRANRDWGAQIGYDEAALVAANRRSVAFMEEVRDTAPPSSRPLVINALIGPRDDAYAPASLMSAEEATTYHTPQLQTLADTAADLATAMTLTYTAEAIGIVRAGYRAGLPVAISFTVETDGRLPSGETLRAAIEQVDDETDGACAYYMINCAHPTHVTPALDDDGPWLERIRGLRPNASTLSHAELNEATEIDAGDPADLAARTAALRAKLPNLTIAGGCCGTNITHVRAISQAWMT